MAWGVLSVGGVVLRETADVDVDGGTVKLTGQESHPPSTRSHVASTVHNIRGLLGSTVPVTFTDKPELDGFYGVTAASAHLVNKQGGVHQTCDWSLTLELVGSDRDVEVESRVPTIARTTTVGTPPAAVFWHAPAAGATSYWTGATVPSVVTRQSADGPLPVYLGIPAGVSPRWTSPVAEYLEGSAQLLFDGIRRVGTLTPPLAVWEVNNGLVRVQSGNSGRIVVSAWDQGQWRSPKVIYFAVDGSVLPGQPEFTVLRNTPEEVAVRLSYPSAPGRVAVDLSLRRGARFVTAVMKRHSVAGLGMGYDSGAAVSTVTGGIRETSADADGNRLVIGSAQSVTVGTPAGWISKSTMSLDFFIGHEVDASPQAGDAFADLWAQYRGSSGEDARVVVR